MPNRRHSSRRFTPSCSNNITNSCRCDMIDCSDHGTPAPPPQANNADTMRQPCPRTPVHYLSRPYTLGAERDSLMLSVREPNDQTVEFVAHLDLARQTRIGLGRGREPQHAGLLRIRLWQADFLQPGGVDIDMAGRAGTLAAAIGIDARHGVVDRAAHHREADRHFDLMLGSVKFDIGDLGHGAYGNNCSPVSASSTKIALTGQFSAASRIFSTVSPAGSTASDWR